MSGDFGPVGAVSCNCFLFDGGAFNSQRNLGGGGSIIVSLSCTVESAISTTFGITVVVKFGRSIGTNADLTTSICSSSESSVQLWSWLDGISFDEFILIVIVCVDGGGDDDDGRDDAGDKREFRLSDEGTVDTVVDVVVLLLWFKRACLKAWKS